MTTNITKTSWRFSQASTISRSFYSESESDFSFTIKVLDYLQKTETLKVIFFLDQSFGIGLKQRQNMFFTKYNASNHNTSLLCFFMFFGANISQAKLNKVSLLFNMMSH